MWQICGKREKKLEKEESSNAVVESRLFSYLLTPRLLLWFFIRTEPQNLLAG